MMQTDFNSNLWACNGIIHRTRWLLVYHNGRLHQFYRWFSHDFPKEPPFVGNVPLKTLGFLGRFPIEPLGISRCHGPMDPWTMTARCAASNGYEASQLCGVWISWAMFQRHVDWLNRYHIYCIIYIFIYIYIRMYSICILTCRSFWWLISKQLGFTILYHQNVMICLSLGGKNGVLHTPCRNSYKARDPRVSPIKGVL